MFLAPFRVVLEIVARRFSLPGAFPIRPPWRTDAFRLLQQLETVVEWTISAASGEKQSRGCFIRRSIGSHHLAVSLLSEPVYVLADQWRQR